MSSGSLNEASFSFERQVSVFTSGRLATETARCGAAILRAVTFVRSHDKGEAMDTDSSTVAHGSLLELARRQNGGVEVALIWNRDTDELTVCVGDEKRNSYFELSPPRDQALDCFYHPYSYAAPAQLPEVGLLAA
jgi:hypothetical protein